MRQAVASFMSRMGVGNIVKASRPANAKEIEKRRKYKEWLEEKARKHQEREHHHPVNDDDQNWIY